MELSLPVERNEQAGYVYAEVTESIFPKPPTSWLTSKSSSSVRRTQEPRSYSTDCRDQDSGYVSNDKSVSQEPTDFIVREGLLRRRKKVRELVGPISLEAYRRFVDLREEFFGADFIRVLNTNRTSLSFLSIKPKLLGATDRDAQLYIVILCEAGLEKRIRKYCQQSHLKSELEARHSPNHPRFRLHIIGRPPLAVSREPLRLEREGYGLSQSRTLCGVSVKASVESKSHIATIGGLVHVRCVNHESLFGITVDHVCPQRWEDLDTEIDLSSLHKEYTDDVYDVCDGDDIEMVFANGEYPGSADPLIIRHDLKDVSWQYLGLTCTSLNLSKAKLDWSLISISDADALLPNWDPSVSDDQQRDFRVFLDRDRIDPVRKSVFLLDGSIKRRRGFLSTTPAYMLLSNGDEIVRVYTLQMRNSDGIRFGDSGTWVIDENTNEIYGHLVAVDVFSEAYVMPLASVFEEICSNFSAISVTLPSAQTVKTFRQRLSLPASQALVSSNDSLSRVTSGHRSSDLEQSATIEQDLGIPLGLTDREYQQRLVSLKPGGDIDEGQQSRRSERGQPGELQSLLFPANQNGTYHRNSLSIEGASLLDKEKDCVLDEPPHAPDQHLNVRAHRKAIKIELPSIVQRLVPHFLVDRFSSGFSSHKTLKGKQYTNLPTREANFMTADDVIAAVTEEVDSSSPTGAPNKEWASEASNEKARGNGGNNLQIESLHTNRSTPKWRPISMRGPYILGLSLIALGLAGFQEFLLISVFEFKSVAHSARSPTLLWKILPTMIPVLYGVAFSILDFDIRRIEPYYQLAPLRASHDSLTLQVDYLTKLQYLLPFTAVKSKQWIVVASSVASIIAATIAPALSSCLFHYGDDTACESVRCPESGAFVVVYIAPVLSRLITAAYLIIAMLIICIYIRLRLRPGLLREPKGIAGVASMATQSHILRDYGSGSASLNDIRNGLAPPKYIRCKSIISQSVLNHVSWHRGIGANKLRSTHPFMLGVPAGVSLLTVLVMIVIMIPVVVYTPGRAVPEAAPWLPVLIITVVKSIWSTFEATVRCVEPFYQLSKGNSRPEKSLTLDYQAMVYGYMPIRAALNNHFLLALVGVSSIGLDILSFAVSPISAPLYIHGERDVPNPHVNDGTSPFPTPLMALYIIILVFVVSTALAAYRQRRHAFLPREPSTIATVLSLIYASKMLHDFTDTERLTNQQLERRLKRIGKRYALGWFEGRDGQIHCAIDEEPRKSVYVYGQPYCEAIEDSRPQRDTGDRACDSV